MSNDVMPTVKILTWNINGIRATRVPLKKLLDDLDADVICLQETKVTRDQLDEVTAVVDGYNSYFSFSKVRSGYSGVATYVKDSATPYLAEDGLSGSNLAEGYESVEARGQNDELDAVTCQNLDCEGRCVITQHHFLNGLGQEESLAIINVYCPRANPENTERLSFKLTFYRFLQLRAEAIRRTGCHVIVLGDINTSHKMIDHCNPDNDAEFRENPGRQWMDRFVSSCELDELEHGKGRQFFDTFRWLHPDQQNAFTNWCTTTGARKTNYGCRLDYIIADFGMMPYLQACTIMADIEGSDHCPVKAEFSCSIKASPACPPLCTKYYRQFAGRQQKLEHFMKRKSFSEGGNTMKPCSNSVGLSGSGDSHGQDQKLISAECSIHETLSSKSSAGDLKRPSSYPAAQKFKKSKSCDVNANGKQKNLLSFFIRNIQHTAPVQIATDSNSTDIVPSANNFTDQTQEVAPNDDNQNNRISYPKNMVVSKVYSKLASESGTAWKNLLKGPPQTPLCSGHREPCVLRTVKREGPNKGRQFWTCNKPEGRRDDPKARCDYFLWVTK